MIKKLLATLALVVSMSVSAATYTFDYGTWLGSPTPSYQPNQNFAKMVVTSEDNKSFLFKLDVFDNINTLFGTGSYIDAALFNTLTNTTPEDLTFATGTWGVNSITLQNTAPNIGGISFDFKDKFGNANNAGNRLTAGESVAWILDFTIAQNILFDIPSSAIHVAGFDQNGVRSGWYTPINAVPLPAALWLMLPGLALLGYTATRRKI